MKTKLLKKLRKKAYKKWSVGTDSFGQSWIYAYKTAMRNVVCHKTAKRIVDELRRDMIIREVTIFRFRKRRVKKVRIY